jgi:hypothetical protein
MPPGEDSGWWDDPAQDPVDDDPDTDIPKDAVTTLALPVVPVDAVPAYVVMSSEEGTGRLVGSTSINMGWGEGYPTDVGLWFDTLVHNQCLVLEGVFREEEFENSAPSVATFAGRRVRLHEPGYTRLTVPGVYHPIGEECAHVFTEPGSVPVELPIDLTVHEPARVQWRLPALCTQEYNPSVLSGGTTEPGLLPSAATRDATLQLANATPERQVALSLTVPEGMGMVPPSDGGGVDHVRFVGKAGDVLVQTLADPLSLQVVPFVGAMTSHGRPLCTQPERHWFELAHDDCGDEVEPSEESWGVQRTVGLGLHIERDGPCQLQLLAPDLGDGLSVQVGVTFLD